MSAVLNSLFYFSHYFRVYTGISNISNIFVWISMSPITPCVSESISLSSSISFLVILYPLSSSWSSFILLRACCLPGLFEGSRGARGLKLEERRSALLPPSAAAAAAAGHQSRMWPNPNVLSAGRSRAGFTRSLQWDLSFDVSHQHHTVSSLYLVSLSGGGYFRM